MERIEPDSRIELELVVRFVNKVKTYFIDQDYDSTSPKEQRKALSYTILLFIYHVRNNIFHGTKTLTQMSQSSQQKRIAFYTAILLAINESFFMVVEELFNWKPVRVAGVMPTQGPSNNSRVYEPALRGQQIRSGQRGFPVNTVKEQFGIEVPKGALFYPCAGSDTFLPISLFLDSLEEFHFVDNKKVELPCLECQGDERPRNSSRRGYFTQEIVSAVQDINLSKTCSPIEYSYDHEIEETVWKGTYGDQRYIKLFAHRSDNVVAIESVDKLAVFYYCGDSLGEGGSGQCWLGDQLFSKVLGKLVVGGLVITDGSNRSLIRGENPWNTIWSERGLDEDKPRSFNYLGRDFTLIGSVGRRYGNIYAWQVK